MATGRCCGARALAVTRVASAAEAAALPPAQRSFASTALVVPPRSQGVAHNRWLPVNRLPPEMDHTPRKGWMDVERWQDKPNSGGVEPVKGCSALVITLRKALRTRPGSRITPQSFWRRAAARGGQLVSYFSPEETCEILSTLADAKLQWRGDPKSSEGLRRFAAHTSQELSSYSAAQLGELAWAMARLGVKSEELLQAFSRTVEHMARADRGRISNESMCVLLQAYRKSRVIDEVLMRSLSKLLCRRLVREPLTAQQTAGVLAAYADLRARDTFLFNAGTLALCRRDAVESLDWSDLAEVMLAYASLRLHSPTLFARMRARLIEGAGIDDSPAGGSDDEAEAVTSLHGSADGARLEHLWDELREAPPAPPWVQFSQKVTANFLQAFLHLGFVSKHDLAPLLPHLHHPAESRPGAELARLMVLTLSKGGHTWPWLWRKASVAFAADRKIAPVELLSLTEALRLHALHLEPLLSRTGTSSAQGAGDGSLLGEPDALVAELVLDGSATSRARLSPLADRHLRNVAVCLAGLWAHTVAQCRGLTDTELENLVNAAPALLKAQVPLAEALGGDGDAAASAVRRAGSRAAWRLAAEAERRRSATEDQLAALLLPCGLDPETVIRQVRPSLSDGRAAMASG